MHATSTSTIGETGSPRKQNFNLKDVIVNKAFGKRAQKYVRLLSECIITTS
jgi:hypothetical protein